MQALLGPTDGWCLISSGLSREAGAGIYPLPYRQAPGVKGGLGDPLCPPTHPKWARLGQEAPCSADGR